MKPCDHDSYPKYKALIGPLREKAKELGYALAVHGTLKRDIDIVAVPWTDSAVSAAELARALFLVTREVNGMAWLSWSPAKGREFTLAGCPGVKPHGRLVWVFNLHGGPYIDLSVMPRSTIIEEKRLTAWDGQ